MATSGVRSHRRSVHKKKSTICPSCTLNNTVPNSGEKVQILDGCKQSRSSFSRLCKHIQTNVVAPSCRPDRKRILTCQLKEINLESSCKAGLRKFDSCYRILFLKLQCLQPNLPSMLRHISFSFSFRCEARFYHSCLVQRAHKMSWAEDSGNTLVL